MEGHLAQGTSALGSGRMLPSQESFLHGVLLDPFALLLCPLPPCPAVGPAALAGHSMGPLCHPGVPSRTPHQIFFQTAGGWDVSQTPDFENCFAGSSLATSGLMFL